MTDAEEEYDITEEAVTAHIDRWESEINNLLALEAGAEKTIAETHHPPIVYETMGKVAKLSVDGIAERRAAIEAGQDYLIRKKLREEW